MPRLTTAALLFLLATGVVLAQDAIRTGKVKAVDPDKGTVTITVGDKDETFTLTSNTRVMGVDGKAVAKPFEDKVLSPGSAVQFKTARRDGKAVLFALRPAAAAKQPVRQPMQTKFDSSKLRPLPELGTGKYQGYEGGLYTGGKSERPAGHEAAGLALARQVRPLGPDGKPAVDGKIVLLSVGMSNTTQSFGVFMRHAASDNDKSAAVVLLDGAQGGMTAFRIKDPEDNATGTKYWTIIDQRLESAGATREQVQVAWIKQADAGPTSGFPKYAETLRDELRQIVQQMHQRFPNLKLVYFSSRTYGGYATTTLNPEPYAYESGLSVKWLVEEQIRGSKELNFDPKKGEVKAPWLSWGPYLWANGKTKNADGLFYEPDDFGKDGTHPTSSGRAKVAGQLLEFFKTDSTAKVWFLRERPE